MEEIWKDIPGYENWYQASSRGRIRSLNREIIKSNGWKQLWPGRILRPSVSTNKYLMVVLTKMGVRRSYTVHRLIISSFIENVDFKIDVNHIDSNKMNNSIDNLEYATRSENMRHAYSSGGLTGKCKGRLGRESPLSKKLVQRDDTGSVLNVFYGTAEAHRVTGLPQPGISCACNKPDVKYKGFYWNYL